MKKTIGENIAYYRKKSEMTQAELAEKMDVSVQAVSKWENDISYPDVERICILAKILNVSTEHIINGEESIAITEVRNGSDISKRLLIITVKMTRDQHAHMTLRIPAELILKAYNEGTLNRLIDDGDEIISDTVIEMVTNGVVGPITELKTEYAEIMVEVVAYEDQHNA